MTTLEILRFFNNRNQIVAQGIFEGYIPHDRVEVDQENGVHRLFKKWEGGEVFCGWIRTNPEDQEDVDVLKTLTQNFNLNPLEEIGMRRILDFNHELREDLTEIFRKSIMA